MANLTVKVEGIDSVEKFLKRKRQEIFSAGAEVVNEYIKRVLASAKSKIHHISGETAASLDHNVWKYTNTAVGKAGTIKATKEECIRANSLEYGHALPGGGKDSGVKEKNVVKTVKPHPFMRPALAEIKTPFKRDMQKAIQDVADRG
jgi:hypothetical protein